MHYSSASLSALCAAGLVARLLGWCPALEWLNYGVCLVAGLLLGIGWVSTLWQRAEGRQQERLARATPRTREELFLLDFWADSPWRGGGTAAYHLSDGPRGVVNDH